MHVDRVKQTLLPISSRWSLEVLARVNEGPVGFNDLARFVGVDHRCLGRTLRRLMQVGLISRQIELDSPIRVRYSLTPFGQEAISMLDGLAARWLSVGEAHTDRDQDDDPVAVAAALE
jgi:DNA-binding HxlR family transcriptional regulator